jgi:hypothetical protein
LSSNFLCGTECPACEASTTRVRNTGIDDDGRSIRQRVCIACEHTFYTIEAVIPDPSFEWSRANVRQLDRGQRSARFAPDRISVGAISVRRGQNSDYCYRGLHLIVGDNLFRSNNGRRRCRECRRVSKRAYYEANAEHIRLKQKEQRARRRSRAVTI